jgi:hypothetical protein
MRHSHHTATLIRPPGVPPSECGGTLVRVGPDGGTIDEDEPAIRDDALPHEGNFGELVDVYLRRCISCGETLVEARTISGQGRNYLRNSWTAKVRPEPVATGA